MNLIIVESPTKARTLGRFLGKDYDVVPTMGHIVDLPKSKLGIDIEHNFSPEYVPLEKKQNVAKTIKTEAKKADEIYLATDPDREGEAIAYHVAELLSARGPVGSSSRPTSSKDVSAGALRDSLRSRHPSLSRVVFHEITESAVKHALENPRDIDIKLYDAQQARRVLDRLVGYKLSPLLWKKVRRGLSAGRVQSVAVRLIVEREREIEAFKPDEYWQVFVEVKTTNSKQQSNNFVVELSKIGDSKAEVKNKEQAEKIVADLEKASYTVSDVKKREVHKKPYAPFTTSTMAQAAAHTFYWSAKKTMSVAQKLYEEGLITYHRTDSLNLNKEAVFAAREYVGKKYGKEFVPEKPRFYKTQSRVAQEAHEAIRPTDVKVASDESRVMSLGNDGRKLYELIWKRFVSCQMSEAVYDETTISVNAAATSYLLAASGQIMKFEGWRAVYGEIKNQKSKIKTEEGEEQRLPEVVQGDPLKKMKVLSEQKFTQPPPRYNEASLIKTLEKLGIGRPSTYAPTITTIQDRQYIEKEDGKFMPTALGIAVNDFLLKNFSDTFDYQFTAHMEGDLDEIAKGEKKWIPVIRDFWDPFAKKLEGVEEHAKRVKIEVEKTGETCPKCSEGEQVVRIGRFGKFLSCSRFPDCDWKAPYIETINMKCPECKKGEVVIKKTRKGKSFYGCSRYPECKWASWKKPQGAENNPITPLTQ
ncbi:MAG: DNA topoisomerase I [Candidatus Blackburnbacteria bacterium RIFCSPHIGHO2_01_FULL_43_15b]|uniref:DNA topoisomerase 1 n=1 Tax=Candidatus Blackburnbacteria bacterium RIFCSPHIGHO2_01_FULL_43_15b TaxID=1797513 RepID=A0A1G1UYJ7_9BACT|nr:MAG: DNA topoisomerase I [Candidatus Blackburnbacteria bacterium RIFCSPHIGHO2_01_FULL_43_15b]